MRIYLRQIMDTPVHSNPVTDEYSPLQIKKRVESLTNNHLDHHEEDNDGKD